MRRKLAFAMAVSMLITSVPANSLTGLAEEAVIVEELSAQDEGENDGVSSSDAEGDSEMMTSSAGSESDVLPDEILETEGLADVTAEEFAVSDTMTAGEAAEQTAVFSIESIDVMETEPELQILSEDIAVHDEDLWTDMDTYQYFVGDVGDVHTLYAEAYSNAGLALTYKWYDENRDLIEGTSESSYTFECEKNTMYYCCISDEQNNQIWISYDIEVNTLLWDSALVPNRTLRFPSTAEVVLKADDAVFSTYGSITYRWYRYIEDWNELKGEITDTLNLGKFNDLQYFSYKCVISDGNSTETIWFSLEHSEICLEYLSSDTFYISVGQTVTMSAKATAAVPTDFQWYFNDSALSGAVTSGNSSTLTVTPTISGDYYCKASLGENTDQLSFYVEVDSGLHIGDDTESSVYGKIGDTVTLTANAYSENQYPLTYQWYYSSDTSFGDSDSQQIDGAVSSSLTLENITENDFGYYECKVSDGYSTRYYSLFLEHSNTLNVRADNLVQKVNSNDTPKLQVTAETTIQNGSITYQWYRTDAGGTRVEIPEATNSDYTTPAITDDCTYQCRIKDGFSTQWLTFSLTLQEINTDGAALTFADAKELTLNQPAAAVIPYADTAMYFKFTPTKNGWYKICSSDTKDDPIAGLYDDHYNLLTSNDDSDDYNFKLLYDMLMGKTYYIKAYYSGENTGSYPITVSETDNHTCDWDEGVVIKEPTCTNSGKIRYTCTICQKTFDDGNLYELGHSYGSLHEIADATCSQEGIAYRECSRCGKIQTIKRSKTAHTYGAEQTDTSSAVTKTYKICQSCGAEQIVSVKVNEDEQQKIEIAKQAIESLNASSSSGSVTEAVTAVTAMDNQALIDVDENTDIETAITMVSKLENELVNSSGTGIEGTIIESTVTDAKNGGELSDAEVSGAAVTVASVLMNASASSSDKQPSADNSYYAEVSVKDTTTSETAAGTYSIDISMNIIEKDSNNNISTFSKNVQPAAPILITIPVPSKYLTSEFELLHKGKKVNYTRNNLDQTISFYAASLSPWELKITKCSNHKYVTDTTKSVDATCTSLGKKVFVCSVCTYEKVQILDKKEHTLTDWTVSVPATCTTNGKTCRYCSVCHATVEEKDILANGSHNWVTVIDAASTCGTNGSQHQECSICHATQAPTVLPATGVHNWITVTDVVQTCGANGSQHQECSVCHEVQNATVLPATGAHNYVNFVVTQAATALKEGTETGTCSVCGAAHTRSIAKLTATLKLTSNKLPLQLKKSANLSSLVTGLAAGDSIKSWKSNKTAIASVSKSGKVTGKKVGTAKITVTLASGKSAAITVTVQKKAVTTTKVSVTSKNITLNVGKSTTLKPIITPISSLQTATYSSLNKKVAIVNSKGKVTAKAAGKATIVIKSGKKSVKVTVTVPAPEVKNIKNVPTKKTLKKGKSFTLKPTLTPTGASAKFSYSTSDKKVATVDKKGKITAKKKGTAVITVKAGKITKECKITVK